MNRVLIRTLASILACSVLHFPVQANSYITIGITSRIEVAGAYVYFVQADGSLTILRLQDGKVIERRQTNYSIEPFVKGDEVRLPDPEFVLAPAMVGGDKGTSPSATAWIPFIGSVGSISANDDPLICNLNRSSSIRVYSAESDHHPYLIQVFEYIVSDKIQWRGYFPFIGPERSCKIAAITQTGDRILMGFDNGFVICLDRRSGESQWVYVFPYFFGTRSPKTLDVKTSMGMTLLPVRGDYTPRASADGRDKPALIDDLRASERTQAPPITMDPHPFKQSFIVQWFALLAVLIAVATIVLIRRRHSIG